MHAGILLCCASAWACGTPCEELSIDECSSDGDCSIVHGWPLDTEAECIGEPREAGCKTAGGNCSDEVTAATHGRATPWRFSDSCIPEGWTSVELHDASTWPDCER